MSDAVVIVAVGNAVFNSRQLTKLHSLFFHFLFFTFSVVPLIYLNGFLVCYFVVFRSDMHFGPIFALFFVVWVGLGV